MLRIPLLWPSIATPIEEVAGIKDLYAHLTGLYHNIEAWKAALALYQTAMDPPPSVSRDIARRWRFIAANECVLELYHLRARLEKIQSVQLRKCPTLVSVIDASRLRSARKKLDEYFTDIEALRHAIAHKGENEVYPEIHAPDGQYALTGFWDRDRFGTPYKGHMCYLDISDVSLQKITEVVTDFCSGFESAAADLKRQGHLE